METRLWWASLQQHELYHYLFSLYPEFHLEDEGHQWFDRSKWPQDPKGQKMTPNAFLSPLKHM